MDIFNVEVSGVKQALRASGYPMSTDIDMEGSPSTISMIKRGNTLGSCKPGTGHDCYLKGITVSCDITAPMYWWKQFQRYHFADIVSSQSTMHRITKMDIKSQCNKYVIDKVIEALEVQIQIYNEQPTSENFHYVVANIPQGMNLTARIVTNYLQLKTIKLQRRGHKLEEWGVFIDWINELPYFLDLTEK